MATVMSIEDTQPEDREHYAEWFQKQGSGKANMLSYREHCINEGREVIPMTPDGGVLFDDVTGRYIDPK